MKGYSIRRLSHKSDSLNAIVGVLNTLSTRQYPVRHIWGVPFTTKKKANDRIVRIALNWYSETPGTRRSGFPSWSSLGWTSIISPSTSLDGPYSCSGDFNLEIWQNNMFQDISKIEEGYQDAHCMDPESQRLRITAYSVLLDASPWIEPDGHINHQFRSPGTDDLALHIEPYWDDYGGFDSQPDASVSLGNQPVLCVFHSARSRSGLILKCCGKYYERVGWFVMHERLDSSLFQRSSEELRDKSLPGESEAAVASQSRLIQRRTIELR